MLYQKATWRKHIHFVYLETHNFWAFESANIDL